MKILTTQIHAPGRCCLSHTFGHLEMAAEHLVQAFVKQQLKRVTQPSKKLHWWRVGEATRIRHCTHDFAIKEKPRESRVLPRLSGFLAECDDRQSRWQHQPFLRASHCRVDSPLIHLKVHRCDRTDTIDKKQGVAARMIDGFPNTR